MDMDMGGSFDGSAKWLQELWHYRSPGLYRCTRTVTADTHVWRVRFLGHPDGFRCQLQLTSVPWLYTMVLELIY